MRTLVATAAVTFAWLLAGAPSAGAQTRTRPPTVTIISPSEGAVLQTRATIVRGTVTGVVERVTIHVAGDQYQAIVNDGTFEQEVLIAPGDLVIRVVARNESGEGSDEVNVRGEVEPSFLKVILTWEGESTDVDLWVTDPEDVATGYVNQTPAPGRALDIDDRDGLGPETYSITQYIPGTYNIRVNYYEGGPPERFHVRVIIFEGTPRERRAEHRGVLQRPDHNGGGSRDSNFSFTIDLPRLARGGRR